MIRPMLRNAVAHRRLFLGLAALCVFVTGCSRAFWRNQAELDAYDIISQKTCDYRWNVPRYGIVPDPKSRFYSPYDPDSSPLPPDDPAAHLYMHWMDGMEGYKSWHKMGQTFSVENPQWVASLSESDLQGDVISGGSPSGLPEVRELSLRDAINLSLIHSRSYQTEIENVYLAALELTAQRFNFAAQYNAEPFSNGEFTNPASDINRFGLNSGVGISQLLPSGAQYAVSLVNNTLWVFSSGNRTASASSLSYSLVQPLFRGAGRKFVLNNLTLFERQVLYAIRDLARFRKVFFVDTTVGSTGFLNLLRQVQEIQNTEFRLRLLREQIERSESLALEYPSYITATLAARPDDFNIPEEYKARLSYFPSDGVSLGRLVWRGLMNDADEQTVRGLSNDPEYSKAVTILVDQLKRETVERVPPDLPETQIPVRLQQQLRLDSDQNQLVWTGPLLNEDVDNLELFAANNLQLANAIERLILRLSPSVRPLQQIQLESQLPERENDLRSQRAVLQNSIDAFKLFVGLPPDLEVSLDESLLRPFQLIDSELLQVDEDLRQFAKLDIRRLDTESEELDRMRIIVRRLSELHREMEEKSFAKIREDFREVKGIVDSNLPGSGMVSDGQRVVLDPTILQKLEVDIERDRQALATATTLFNFLKDQIDYVDRLVQNETPADIIRELDTKNRNGTVEVDELPEIWDEVFRKRVDLDADGIVDAAEFKVALLKIVLQVYEDMLRINSNLIVGQVGLRAEKVAVNPFALGDSDQMPTMEECVDLALENRLDLMNARARVMDARRQIEVRANALEAVLNVVVDGDLSTRPLNGGGGPSNPLDFRSANSSFSVGFEFTAPVTLVTERNAYNRSIIEYWRAKRTYMQDEDVVKRDVRSDYRNLVVNLGNLENDRRSLRLTAVQYDSAVEGSRSASDALSLLNALNGINTAQNNFIRNWVSYESNRLNIFLNMGIMEIDPRGLWYDPFYQSLDPLNETTVPPEPAMFAPQAAESPMEGPRQVAGTDRDRVASLPATEVQSSSDSAPAGRDVRERQQTGSDIRQSAEPTSILEGPQLSQQRTERGSISSKGLGSSDDELRAKKQHEEDRIDSGSAPSRRSDRTGDR